MIDQYMSELKKAANDYELWKEKQPPREDWFFKIQWVRAFVEETKVNVDYGDLHDYVIDPAQLEARMRRQERVNEKRDFFDRKVKVGDKVYCLTSMGYASSKKSNALLEVVEITPKGTIKAKVIQTALYGKDDQKNKVDELRKLPYDFLIVNELM